MAKRRAPAETVASLLNTAKPVDQVRTIKQLIAAAQARQFVLVVYADQLTGDVFTNVIGVQLTPETAVAVLQKAVANIQEEAVRMRVEQEIKQGQQASEMEEPNAETPEPTGGGEPSS